MHHEEVNLVLMLNHGKVAPKPTTDEFDVQMLAPILYLFQYLQIKIKDELKVAFFCKARNCYPTIF